MFLLYNILNKLKIKDHNKFLAILFGSFTAVIIVLVLSEKLYCRIIEVKINQTICINIQENIQQYQCMSNYINQNFKLILYHTIYTEREFPLRVFFNCFPNTPSFSFWQISNFRFQTQQRKLKVFFQQKQIKVQILNQLVHLGLIQNKLRSPLR